jgi:hypothetical protein
MASERVNPLLERAYAARFVRHPLNKHVILNNSSQAVSGHCISSSLVASEGFYATLCRHRVVAGQTTLRKDLDNSPTCTGIGSSHNFEIDHIITYVTHLIIPAFFAI